MAEEEVQLGKKMKGTGKPPLTCAHCGEKYDNYVQAARSKFCSPSCRALYSIAHPREPLPVEETQATTANAPTPPPFNLPMNKMNGETGVPMWFYQEKLALISKLENKCDKLEKELKEKSDSVHSLTKDLAVKEVTNTKPEGLGALASPEVITALLQNPDSIKLLMDGVGKILRPGAQNQIGGADNPLLAALAQLPPDMQEKAMVVFSFLLKNPLRLQEFHAQLLAAATQQ